MLKYFFLRCDVWQNCIISLALEFFYCLLFSSKDNRFKLFICYHCQVKRNFKDNVLYIWLHFYSHTISNLSFNLSFEINHPLNPASAMWLGFIICTSSWWNRARFQNFLCFNRKMLHNYSTEISLIKFCLNRNNVLYTAHHLLSFGFCMDLQHVDLWTKEALILLM